MALYTITTKDEFEKKVIQSDKLVLVDFWANWCPPCRAMAPSLHDIASDLDDVVDVVKVNLEESSDNQALANAYGVQGIPNMPVFKDGKEVHRIIGLIPRVQLAATLTELVKAEC